VSTVCVRTVSAAAVFAAAVAVCAAVRREREVRRRLARESASARLMAGCAHRDNEALRRDLEVFRRRLNLELAGRQVVAEADQVLTEALATHTDSDSIDPFSEGGPTA